MFMDVALRVCKSNLTYLDEDRLKSMAACIRRIKVDEVPGDFLEFGMALGGTGICIASELNGVRRFVGFDVFGMIPPPGEMDGAASKKRYEVIRSGQSRGLGGNLYYGYLDNLHEVVAGNFSAFGLPVDGERISLVPGLFKETLPRQPERKIAFAHIDCDWYDPVMECLTYVTPRLSPGGCIILDDYYSWEGCKKATDIFYTQHPELLAQHPDPLTHIRNTHYVLQRQR